MPFSHEWKLERAFKHLDDLRTAEAGWIDHNPPALRQRRDPKSGDVTVYGTLRKQPPSDPFSLLIGDFLHNMRSALDALAYQLASAFTKPLSADITDTSQFPIYGDENRRGISGVGAQMFRDHGRAKVRGWDPKAQAVVEGLQPYHRGTGFRTDPLWILHDLDRINKHRLLHTVVMGFAGFGWTPSRSVNMGSFGPGAIQSLSGAIGKNTPIAVIPNVKPIDANKGVHVEIEPALGLAFAKGTPHVELEPVLQTLDDLYLHVRGTVVPALTGFI